MTPCCEIVSPSTNTIFTPTDVIIMFSIPADKFWAGDRVFEKGVLNIALQSENKVKILCT